MRFRTWPVVAIALLGLLTLIVVSILAAQRKADIAYAHLDGLNAGYRNVETRLRRLRAGLHLSGILVRDYLLDSSTPPGEYRSRLMALREESEQLIGELEPLVREGDPSRFDTLRRELDQYWQSYTPLFDGTTDKDRYAFVRREIVPRRDAVMEISTEIENLNNLNLNAQQEAAAGRQRELHQYLDVDARPRASRSDSLSQSLRLSASALLERRSKQSTSGRIRPSRSCAGSRTSS